MTITYAITASCLVYVLNVLQSKLQTKTKITAAIAVAVCISVIAVLFANPFNWANFVHYVAACFAAVLLGRLVELDKD